MAHVFERWGEEFVGMSCSDCDPTLMGADEREELEAEGETVYDAPYVFAHPKGEPKPDNCPRCGSYLSLSVDEEALTVHGHTLDRMAAKRAAEEGTNAAS